MGWKQRTDLDTLALRLEGALGSDVLVPLAGPGLSVFVDNWNSRGIQARHGMTGQGVRTSSQ